MQVDWSGWARDVALIVLGMCGISSPFAYKFARDEGNSRPVAIFRAIMLFVLLFLWIGGGGIALYGMGMAIERPAESCGIGCVEPGEGHWQPPRIVFLAGGVALMAAAWFLGRLMERFQCSLIAKRSKEANSEPEFNPAEEWEKNRKQLEELREAFYKGGLEAVMQDMKPKAAAEEKNRGNSE